MSSVTTSPVVRVTPFPRTRRAATDRRVEVLHEGAPDAQGARKRQVDARKAQKGYESAERLVYAAEAVIDAGHAGKAGVVLGVAANILIRSRFQAATGKAPSPATRPAKVLAALRATIEAEEADRLADALGGAATTSRAGLSRVVGILRDVLDGLTDGEGGEG